MKPPKRPPKKRRRISSNCAAHVRFVPQARHNNSTRSTQDCKALRISDTPFYPLGYNHGLLYFLPRHAHEIVILTPEQMTDKNLIKLAPLEWWEATYADDDPLVIVDDLIQASYAQGVFNECTLFHSLLRRQCEQGWFR